MTSASTFTRRSLVVAAVLAMVASIMVAFAPSADAATFTVTRTDDPPPDGTCDDDCTLREAVIAANANGEADTIELPPGTYVLTHAGYDDDAQAGDLDITDDLDIVGAGAADTVIDASGLGTADLPDRVFHVHGATSASFSGVTIQEGLADDDPGQLGDGQGGGIMVQHDGALTLTDTIVRDNQAENGAGVHLNAPGASGVFNNGELRGNRAGVGGGGLGGGVQVDSNSITLEIDGTRIAGNVAQGNDGLGGGIGVVGNNTTLTVRNAFIGSNHDAPAHEPKFPEPDHNPFDDPDDDEETDDSIPHPDANRGEGSGGGISLIGDDPTITIADSQIDGNRSDARVSGGGGGAMFLLALGGMNLDVSDTTFNGNKADEAGGAIWALDLDPVVDTPSSTLFTNVEMVNNSADEFGGAYFNILDDATFEGGAVRKGMAHQTSSSSNNDTGIGGGVFNIAASMDFRDFEFTHNKADFAGGAAVNLGGYLGDIPAPGIFTLHDGTLSLNKADGGEGCCDRDEADNLGGGAILSDSGSVTLTDVDVEANRTDRDGGALYVNDTHVSSTRVAFRDNHADGNFGSTAFHGGGAIAAFASQLDIVDSELSGNSTDMNGGAIYQELTSSAGLSSFAGVQASLDSLPGLDSRIPSVELHATREAAAGTEQVQPDGEVAVDNGIASLTNVTISDNTAGTTAGTGRDGAGIYNHQTDLTLEHVTLADNRTAFNDSGTSDFGEGAAIFNTIADPDTGTVTLNSTIVADSLGRNCNDGPGEPEQWGFVSEGDNISDDDSCVDDDATINDQDETDPDLLPLTNNGGPTQTHALPSDSPAVDNETGSLADCPDPDHDQRGVDRPQDGDDDGSAICDTGAFELVAGTDVTVAKTDDPDPVLEGSTLTYTVTVTNAGTEDALGVTLTDDLPDGVTFNSASPDQGTCSETDGTVTCELGDIAAGASVDVTITVTVTMDVPTGESATITNTATVATPFQDDVVPENDTTSEDTTVTARDEGIARTVTVTPADATNEVGTTHSVVAHVEDGVGNSLEGVTVRFIVSGANSAGGSATTNASGDAGFTYGGADDGDDTITAYADLDGDGIRDEGEPAGTASKTWTDAEEPTEPAGVFRLAGDDRFLTAIDISQDSFGDGEAGAVVLARADVFADALAGTPFAVDVNAPLLLTTTDELRPEVRDELRRVLPTGSTVYLLGETAALSENVADQVRAEGYTVVRHGGIDRFATAVEIAQALGDPDTFMIATGFEFVDALAAGPAAIGADAAILLTHRDVQTPTTQDYLDDRSGEFVYAIGGPHANAYAETPQADESVFGDDRFATATAVANEFFTDPTVAGLARSDLFPDSLTGGVHIGRLGGPMLVTPSTFLHDRIETYFCTNSDSIERLFIYGGPVAISSSVANDAGARIRGVGC